MDIASDGTVSVRQGAGAATWEVVTSPASDKTVDQNGQPIIPAWAYTDASPPPVPPQYEPLLKQAATAANISPTLLVGAGLAGEPLEPQAVSPKGAVGPCPADARDGPLSRRQPEPILSQNLIGGARYLRYLLDQFDGDVEKALAAYNAGPGPGAARRRRAGHRRDPQLCRVDRPPHFIHSTGASQ